MDESKGLEPKYLCKRIKVLNKSILSCSLNYCTVVKVELSHAYLQATKLGIMVTWFNVHTFLNLDIIYLKIIIIVDLEGLVFSMAMVLELFLYEFG